MEYITLLLQACFFKVSLSMRTNFLIPGSFYDDMLHFFISECIKENTYY